MCNKPEIFKPSVKDINNNRKTYYSYLDDKLETSSYEEAGNIDVANFINGLSRNGSYLFNKDVVIVTKDKKYETRIAGKMGDRIITLDNDSINVNEIVKIYEKNKI